MELYRCVPEKSKRGLLWCILVLVIAVLGSTIILLLLLLFVPVIL
jgi:hypothetical protein